MNYNSYAATIRKLDDGERIEMLYTNAADIICTTGFKPFLVNDQFCVGFEDVPPLSGNKGEDAYYFNRGYLTIPRKMFRMDSLLGDASKQELAKCIADGGQAITVPYITNVRIAKKKDQSAGQLTLSHLCKGTGNNNFRGQSKTGGGVCVVKQKSANGYVAEKWHWGEVYTADGDDPYGVEENQKEQLIHHYLKGRFNLEDTVRLVSMVMPDNNIVRIPIIEQDPEAVHDELINKDKVYALNNLTFLDGPDIFIGDCDFGL